MPLSKPAKAPRSPTRPIRRNKQTMQGPQKSCLGSFLGTYESGAIVAERHEVVFVDGVRTPFGRAGEKGMYWNTRADDLVVKAMIELLERHPEVPKDRID